MGFLEPAGDVYLLRTDIRTLPALVAPVGTLLLIDKLAVAPPGLAGVSVCYCVVVHLEDVRDLHAAGTGHAILAAGAGNRN